MRTFLLSLLLITTSLGNLSAPAIRIPTPAVLAATPIQSTAPEPLPRGCGSVTPPGDELAACCINGFVYMDGAIIAGAEVTITSPRGDSVVLYTQVYSGTEIRPSYQLSLSVAPLNVQTGETITVAAKYSNHEHSLSYLVQPGSQQVDVVLERYYADDYMFERQIRGQGAPGRFRKPVGVAIDRQHSEVYVVDLSERVQVFDQQGQFLRQWGSFGSSPGQFYHTAGVAVDATGNVYIADVGSKRIQKFDRNGTWLLSWGGPGRGNGQFAYFDGPTDNFAMGIALDSHGNIYVADAVNLRVQKFDSQGRWLLNLIRSSPEGQRGLTWGVAVDTSDRIYVTTDNSPSQVSVHTSDGTLLTTWGIYGTAPGQLYAPKGIAIDSSDYIYVSDRSRVQKFTRTGQWLATWGQSGSGNGEFSLAEGIAVGVNGDIYVSDPDNYRVQRFSTSGTWELSWGGYGRNAVGQFNAPEDVAVHQNGDTYIADTFNNRVQVFNNAGSFLKSWEGWYQPRDITVNANNEVYVADTLNSRIHKYNADGNLLASWGSSGTANGQFGVVSGLVTLTDGSLYVADSSRVQHFSSVGDWLGVWGIEGTANGQLSSPRDIALDMSGNVYVIDLWSRIQKFTPQGQWLTTISDIRIDYTQGITIGSNGHIFVSFGNRSMPSQQGILQFSDTGAYLGSVAMYGSQIGEVLNPGKLTTGLAGRIYIADSTNDRIQIFRPMTYTRPIATITHVSAPSVGQDDTLTLRGLGQDSDETLAVTAYRWTSDKDGVIGTVATLTRAARTLTAGSHRITLEVQDGEGQWSDPVSTSIYVAAPPQVTWTALLYLAGDYGDRGQLLNAFTAALAKLQTSLRNPAIRVAVQVDGPADGDTYRLLIIPGNPPQVTRLEDIGEKAMDSPAALAEFLRWGQGSFPAQHYYLAVANHGQAIQGIAWDLTSDLKDDGVPNYSAYLTSAELGQALRAEGVAPVDVVHLDACSMNLLEVAYELRPLTDVPIQSRLLIASQYLGWNYFAYDTYITAIGAGDTPAQVALSVTDAYAERARADPEPYRVPYTIAALDLGRAGPMATAVDNLGAELAAYVNNDRSRLNAIEAIWQTSPHFESNGDYLNNELDEYVDLPTWASKVQLGVASPAVKQRAFDLINELTGASPFILAGSNRVGHGNLPRVYAGGAFIDLSGASGVSIFYPGRQDTVAFDSYVNNRLFAFTSATRWADFLLSGVSNLSPGPRKPFSGPLTNLDQEYRVMLPLIHR